MSNKSNQIQEFKKKLNNLISKQTCKQHQENLTFICLQPACRAHNLICSLCLTIQGPHKNHDSIQIHHLMQKLFQKYLNNKEQDSSSITINRINQQYQNLLKIITGFHQRLSQMIKNFIIKRNQIHITRKNILINQSIQEYLKSCKYDKLEQFNNVICNILNRLKVDRMQIDLKLEQKNFYKFQYYLKDIEFQKNSFSCQLSKIRKYLEKQLFINKEYSPVVLASPRYFGCYVDFLQNQDIVYIGQISNNKPHGKGIAYYKNSLKLIQGYFKNGLIEGNGTLYFKCGDIYTGQFHQDKKQGKGIYIWKQGSLFQLAKMDGHLYEGQFSNSKRHGRGIFIWNDGSRYEGFFHNGMQNGYGEYYRSDGFKEYQGQWKNGKFEGDGIQYFENGEKYQGEFKNDKFHGKGIFYKTDSIINGVWKDSDLQVMNMVKSILPKQKQIQKQSVLKSNLKSMKRENRSKKKKQKSQEK